MAIPKFEDFLYPFLLQLKDKDVSNKEMKDRIISHFSLSEVINRNLRQGDRVHLRDWGLMKLEIESDKVDNLKDFRAKKHIRGVRLHFIPESSDGSPALYDGITFEKERT